MGTIGKNRESLVKVLLDSSRRFQINNINPHDVPLAYFSGEYGMEEGMPIYSGGLGILSGDHMKALADLGYPAVGVGLKHEQGYFKQRIGKDGWQVEEYPKWYPEEFMKRLDAIVDIPLGGETVKVGASQYTWTGQTGKRVPLILLDTNVEGNSERAKTYTHNLYGRDADYRIVQAYILAIGGLLMLRKLGYDNIQTYHMNEGHSAFLPAQLLDELDGDKEAVRDKCVFTTHTPVGAGHERFTYHDISNMLGQKKANQLFSIAEDEGKLSMSALAFRLSRYSNGVSRRHAEIAGFPGLEYITNGVHPLTWTSRPMRQLFNDKLPGWSLDPTALLGAQKLRESDVIEAHTRRKKSLMNLVNNQNPAVHMDYDAPTFGLARRFADYKRMDLLFSDIDRLKSIAKKTDAQFLIAGKAHPQDEWGKKVLQKAIQTINKLSGKVKISFLENYNMAIGRMLTSGCDFWLNTPHPPYEASGTSGMKAMLNGVINISIMDGWCCEGLEDGVNGFVIGSTQEGGLESERNQAADAKSLLDNIERATRLHSGKARAGIMKNGFVVGSHFTSIRMVKEYWEKAYRLS